MQAGYFFQYVHVNINLSNSLSIIHSLSVLCSYAPLDTRHQGNQNEMHSKKKKACKHSTRKVTSSPTLQLYKPMHKTIWCNTEKICSISPLCNQDGISHSTVCGGGVVFFFLFGEKPVKLDQHRWHGTVTHWPTIAGGEGTRDGERKNKLINNGHRKKLLSIYVRVRVIVTSLEWCRGSLIISQEPDKISVPWRECIDFPSAKATYSLCGARQ